MKTFSAVVLSFVLGAPIFLQAKSATIVGAGATFPDPIYRKWADKYQKITGIRFNYQAQGSGFGIAQVQKKLVDFGATDAPLKAADLKKVNLVQFPMIIGGVVPVVNIKDIAGGELRLAPAVLADIYLGKIVKWNDRRIKETNLKLNLPDQDITVVHRSDGSGTTWLFTNYLDKVSAEWHKTVGTDKAVPWPVGLAGKGNAGVAAYVQQTPGSIGYVEYAYALQNKMTYSLLQNKAGSFVAPTIKTFQAAAANADWKKSPGYYVVLTDQAGTESWPITGASFILLQSNQPDAAKAKTVLSFFNWCYEHGGPLAEKLDYVPIPKNVTDLVRETWKKEIKANGESVWP